MFAYARYLTEGSNVLTLELCSNLKSVVCLCMHVNT